jgi:hypothetical protein
MFRGGVINSGEPEAGVIIPFRSLSTKSLQF